MSDGISNGHLQAARTAGAHDEYIAFVAEYPESPTAESLRTAISMDALDHFEEFGSSFETALFTKGAKYASNADRENEQRMRELFDEEQLPQWMRGETE